MEQVAGDKMMTEGAFGYVADNKVPEASTSVPMMRSKPMGQSSKPVIVSYIHFTVCFVTKLQCAILGISITILENI